MKKKIDKNLLIKNNLKIIFDTMIPGDKYMPSFTKAVNVKKLINKISNKEDFKEIKMNKNTKLNLEFYTDILGDTVLEAYFTSNLVVKALELRKKNYLKNTKKEDMYKLLAQTK